MALQLASNVLRVDIVLITAFHESAVHKDLGLTIIKSLDKSNPEPLYLFYYSESDFSSAHFQSIFPRCADNVVKTYLTSLTPSLTPSLTEESLQDIPIVLDSQYSQLEISNEPFQSTRVVISSSVGENPVSLMAQEVVPRKRGRPEGSKNKRSQKLHGHLVPRWEPRVEKQVVGEVGDAPEEGEEDILEICCNHSLMCSPCLAPEG